MSYLNGCTHVLLVWVFEHIRMQVPTFPEKRHRIHCWASIKTFALTTAMPLLANLKSKMVLPKFEGITKDDLLPCDQKYMEAEVEEKKRKKKRKRGSVEKMKKLEKMKKIKHDDTLNHILFERVQAIRSLENKIIILNKSITTL